MAGNYIDENIERTARLINADKDEVTNTYRPAITAKLIFYNMFDWFEGDKLYSLICPTPPSCTFCRTCDGAMVSSYAL